MITQPLYGLTALIADWERVPVCDWCRPRCRGLCPPARRIGELEWEVERARNRRCKTHVWRRIYNDGVNAGYRCVNCEAQS